MLADGLGRELSQVQALDRSVLIVEGVWGWRDDVATRVHGGNGKGTSGFTRSQFDGVMRLAGALAVRENAHVAAVHNGYARLQRLLERGPPRPQRRRRVGLRERISASFQP